MHSNTQNDIDALPARWRQPPYLKVIAWASLHRAQQGELDGGTRWAVIRTADDITKFVRNELRLPADADIFSELSTLGQKSSSRRYTLIALTGQTPLTHACLEVIDNDGGEGFFSWAWLSGEQKQRIDFLHRSHIFIALDARGVKNLFIPLE